MNRFRLIDEVSIYLLGRNNCHITLLYDLQLTRNKHDNSINRDLTTVYTNDN